MTRQSETNALAPTLRQRAEAALRQQPPDAAPPAEGDPQRLIHELQVHQVELELQNEALRRNQDALQRARDQYAMLYDLAPVGYVTLDAQGGIVAANLTAAEMLGLSRSTLPGTPLSRFVVRDDQDRLYLHRRRVWEVDTRETCDLRLQRPDGREWEAALDSRRVPAEAGQGQQCFTTLRDITARQQAERALRQSEGRIRGIVETAVDGIMTIDAQGVIDSFNPAAERLFGYPAAEVIGQPVRLLMPAPERDAEAMVLVREWRAGEHDGSGTGREVVGKRRDGTTFPMELAVGATDDGRQHLVTVIMRDISERKRVAEALQRAERLALMGQLASGLAHEIGTPLNIIAGNSELLCMDLQARHLPTEPAEMIIRQVDRITGLVNQFLTLGHSEPQAMRPFALRPPLDEALHLLETAFQRDHITVTCDLPDDLALLWGIADQLEQVFLNVLVNAWQAMPAGGSLTIAARETADRRIQMRIRDTGVGMAPAEVARAFEPFYTGKGERGTGLGLTVCKQLIEAHQGHITLESTPGVGTTVHLDLACAPAVG